jgi:multiple sugar transport system substrate-binding protein
MKGNQVLKASQEIKKLIEQLKQNNQNTLPSELNLAERFHVGRNTIRNVIGELEKEGKVERIRGKGTFIVDNLRELSFYNWTSAEYSAERFASKLIDDFNRVNEEISIQNNTIPYRSYLYRVFSAMLRGKRPDVIQITPFWLRRLHRFDLFLPLSDFVSQSLVKRRYSKAFQLGNIGDEIYCLNWALCPLVLYYNKVVLEKAGLDPERPPDTLGEMAEMSIRVSETPDNELYGICLPFDMYEISFLMLYPFFLSFRGGFTDAIGNIHIDTEENIQALSWLKALYSRAGVKKENSIDETRLLFASDQLAFMIDGPYGRGNIRELSGKGKEFDSHYGIVEFPTGSSDKSESLLLSHALSIPRQTRNPLEAFSWVEYLCTDERNSQIYFEEFGMIPCNRDHLQKPFFSSDPFAAVLIKQIETASTDPIMHPLLLRIIPFLQQAITAAVLHNHDPARSLAFAREAVPTVSKADSLMFF